VLQVGWAPLVAELAVLPLPPALRAALPALLAEARLEQAFDVRPALNPSFDPGSAPAGAGGLSSAGRGQW
jgi:hypothetical protein